MQPCQTLGLEGWATPLQWAVWGSNYRTCPSEPQCPHLSTTLIIAKRHVAVPGQQG